MADGLAVGGWAPRPPRVQGDLGLQPVSLVFVQEVPGHQGGEQGHADGALETQNPFLFNKSL